VPFLRKVGLAPEQLAGIQFKVTLQPWARRATGATGGQFQVSPKCEERTRWRLNALCYRP